MEKGELSGGSFETGGRRLLLAQAEDLLGKRPPHVENRKDRQVLDPQRARKLESGAASFWCNRPDNEERELR